MNIRITNHYKNKKYFINKDNDMLLHFNVFLAISFFSFCEISSVLASDHHSELIHVKDNEIVARYSDNLIIGDYSYDLQYKIDSDLSQKVFKLKGYDGTQHGANHLFANGVYIYKNGGTPQVRYKHFTTRNFHSIGIGEKEVKSQIDWMSGGSKLSSSDSDNEIYYHKSKGRSDETEGHSECRLIADIEALFKKDSDSLIKLFTPSSSTRNAHIIMSGLELYGSYDMCDSCLGRLFEFRKKHQEGQQSIAYAIRDKLKITPKNVENYFVIIYHTTSPYGEAIYHTEYQGQNYELSSSTYVKLAQNEKTGVRSLAKISRFCIQKSS